MAAGGLSGSRDATPGLGHVAAHATSWFSLAVYGFVASTIVFRSVGQAEFGIWATIAAFRSALLFLDAGLAFGVTRDAAIARAGDATAHDRLRVSYLLYFLVAVLALILGVSLSWLPGELLGLGGSRPDVALLTMLIGVETALAFAAAPAHATLRGLGRFDLLAVASAATATVGTILLLLLTPEWGLLGAGVAVTGARMVGAIAAFVAATKLIRLGSLRQWTRSSMRRVVGFALPLWAVAIGSAIGMATDVPIVGAFFGADAAGAYGIGAVIPSVVAGLVFVLVDTAFPRMATLGRASVGQVTRLVSTAGVMMAAVGLGAIALSSADVMTVWLGSAPDLATSATVAYAAVWVLNVPAHVLVLSAIARDQHHVVGRIVVAESLVNVALSFLLAATIGPIGPAIATVVTVGASNAVVLPAVLAPRIGIAPGRLLIPAGAVALTGIVVAALARLAVLPLEEPMGRIAAHAALVGLAMASIGVWVVVRRVTVQRWLGILFDGGWRVLRQERSERVAMRRVLAHRSSARPRRVHVPLVTIRIATYNRGVLVAERAIASALAQTHPNIEVVVVGDRCDEATEAAVRSIKDPRVRFENLPRRGSYPDDPMFRWMVAGAAPMNRALALARGEWIAPLDDDDEFTPDHVEVLLDACRARDLDAAYGVADMEVRPNVWEPVGEWPPRPGGIVHASVLYSLALRPMLHSFESWRLNEPGDWNLWRRMLTAGARFGFVDQVVVKHYLEYRDVLAEARR